MKQHYLLTLTYNNGTEREVHIVATNLQEAISFVYAMHLTDEIREIHLGMW